MKEKKDVDCLKYVPINHIYDGVYIGEAKTLLIKAEVEVTVSEGEISKIQILKHEHGLGKRAEAIVESMIQENTWDVDTISGATLSSQVIKNAVNQALKEREKE